MMGLLCIVAMLVADVPEVAPEKLPEVAPIDVPALLGRAKEPEPEEGAPPEEAPGLPRNKLSLGAVFTDGAGTANVYGLFYEHYLGKTFVEKGEPLDLAHFLQKRGLIDIRVKVEHDYSLDPPTSWEFCSVRHGGEGPLQLRFGLIASQDSWSTSYAYRAGLGAGACLYLGPYLRLGYLYYYIRDTEEFQYAFEEGRYADTDAQAVDAAVVLRAGRQYFLVEGELHAGPAGDFAEPESWRTVLSYYPVAVLSLSGEYSESAGVEVYGGGISAYLGRTLGVSVVWTTAAGSGTSLFDARVALRF